MATELLIDRATVGLNSIEQVGELRLLDRFPNLDDNSFELAAAAVDLAYTTPTQPMPATLRQRVSAQAADYFQAQEPEASAADVVPFPGSHVQDPTPAAEPNRWLGWVAAAACLALAVWGWWPGQPVSPAQARATLVAQASDLVELEWTATEDPAASGASGDVVWSNSTQSGFMRFTGLPVNDPTVEQYQLWIFDAQQDQRFPVDGGVFDINSTGETVVPIDPKLRIADPTLFAITIEKPGGVVVSSRERLPLLAKIAEVG